MTDKSPMHRNMKDAYEALYTTIADTSGVWDVNNQIKIQSYCKELVMSASKGREEKAVLINKTLIYSIIQIILGVSLGDSIEKNIAMYDKAFKNADLSESEKMVLSAIFFHYTGKSDLARSVFEAADLSNLDGGLVDSCAILFPAVSS